MIPRIAPVLFLLALMVLDVSAQERGSVPYRVEFDQNSDVRMLDQDASGNRGLFINVKFGVTLDGAKVTNLGNQYRVIIEEDGKRVKEVDLPTPKASEDLSAILAMDTSGSMTGQRMPQAREAAITFLSKLPTKAECGLILFDHQIRQFVTPSLRRDEMQGYIQSTQPRGGTAYLDAAAKAIELLANTRPGKERAVVLLTDGIDLNSSATQRQVIEFAKTNRVRIYTIGIGEPAKNDPVNSVLVLDRSGSMMAPAADDDPTPKIAALHEAGRRFVQSMSSSGRAMLVPFSSKVSWMDEFTQDKRLLRKFIEGLRPAGETALYDATFAALAILEADGTRGKRAVVAMTDGVDNCSVRRVDEVIQRARTAEIPVHVLGFGRAGELDEGKMRLLAEQTGGQYHHARNRDSLIEIFESLSIRLHDDGVDETALRQLAQQTGGEYFPAKNIADLKFILERVSSTIQKESYEITFKSLRQISDGTQRNVALKLVRRGEGTDTVVQVDSGRYLTQGLVVAEMNHLVYLTLLVVLAALALAPHFWRIR